MSRADVFPRSAVLAAWRKRVVDGYRPETAKFLDRQKDPFRNPVGQAIRDTTARVLDGLLADASEETQREALDPLVRIRAVEELPPSKAMGFLLDLKMVLEEQDAETRELDLRIDRLLLTAFDLYTGCRQKIMDVRLSSAKRSLAVGLPRRRAADPAEPHS